MTFNINGRYFEGICDSTSSTFAVVEYLGLKDTIYIEVEVNDTVPAPNSIEFSSYKLDENNIIVFPNPTKGHFTLSIENSLFIDSKVLINNVLGQVVSTINIIDANTAIDISEHPNGIYFVRFRDKCGVETTKKIQKK